MQIRKMTTHDLPQVAEIEKKCFEHPWTLAMLADSLANSEFFFVAQNDDMIIGYCGMYPSGDIANIAVLEDYRGEGIGFKLLNKLIEIGKFEGISSIFLEVRKSNLKAIKLYEKSMFRHINTRKNYYKNGEDALIFMLEVK